MSMQVIDIKGRKPKNKQYVLVHLTLDNWGDKDDPHGDRYWVVAKYIEGITREEREKLDANNPKKRLYKVGDVFGNNLVPYSFTEFGPNAHCGQDVDYWCELPFLI